MAFKRLLFMSLQFSFSIFKSQCYVFKHLVITYNHCHANADNSGDPDQLASKKPQCFFTMSIHSNK